MGPNFHFLLYETFAVSEFPMEVQGSLGESSEIFVLRLCKMLCRSHDDQRAGSFLIFEATDFNGSSDRQCGLCSGNCERQRCVRRNLLRIVFVNLYIIAAF